MAITLHPDNILEMDFMTNSYNADPHLCAREEFLFQMTQEATTIHAHLCHSDLPALHKEGRTWVVSRTVMKIDTYAVWPQIINVRTWAQEPELFFFPRVTTAELGNATPLFSAVTWWAVLDLSTERPIHPKEMVERFGVPPLDDDHPRYPARYKRYRGNVPEGLIPFSSTTPTPVYEDIDNNKHVNNVAYVQWLLDSLPPSFRSTYKASMLDVSWLQQVYLEDCLTLHATIHPAGQDSACPHLHHTLTRQEKDGSETLVWAAESYWKKRDSMVTGLVG